jgi:heptosyltransferase-1
MAPMGDILFVKTSSLGDVIHHMPAVTDARRAWPHARLVWMVEEAYVPLVRLHPGVDEALPVATRRWRGAALDRRTWREIGELVRLLRARRFAAVVDAQGLLRSAALARLARGPRHGYDRGSIREPLASLFYDVRHAVSRSLHAVERNRRLAALALGYAPEGPLDYGLSSVRMAATSTPCAVLLHGSARPEKEWPETHWATVATMLHRRGLVPVLPWGTAAERARSERLAARVPDARVPDRQPLDGVARLIAGAALAVGLDTGLTHLAAALGVPLVAIFTASDPQLTGPVSSAPLAVVGGPSTPPPVEAVVRAIDRVLDRPAAPATAAVRSDGSA